MAIPENFCEIWFQYLVTGDNEPMFTHLAFEMLNVLPTQAQIDAGFTAWQSAFDNFAAADTNLIGGHILQGAVGGSIRHDSSVGAAAGTVAGQSVPNNTAYLVRKSTALGGRRGRGRMFIPSVPETNVNGAGTVSSGVVTAMNAALALFMPGGSINTAFSFLGDPYLLHDTAPFTPTEITDLGCQPKVATQRRRLRK